MADLRPPPTAFTPQGRGDQSQSTAREAPLGGNPSPLGAQGQRFNPATGRLGKERERE